MPTPPESSSADGQSRRISDLQAGLAALKQNDYPMAIVLLEPALSLPTNHPLVARSQMGLVVAYEKLGEVERAAELCQSLSQHPTESVSCWANQMLAALVKRHPRLSALVTAAPPEPLEPAPTATAEVTGFMPLDAETLPPQTVVDADVTGFTPVVSTPLTASPDQPLPTGQTPNAPPQNRRSRGEQRPPKAPSSPPSATSGVAPLPAPSLYQPVWRQAGRAKQGKSLGRVNRLQLVVVQLLTAIALWFGVQQVFYWVAASYGNALIKVLPKLGFRVVQPGAPLWTVSFCALLVLVALAASRWILDGLLTMLEGLQPLSLNTLSTYSPEAARSLNRYCQTSKVTLPALGVLPTQTPIAFTYGAIPQFSRIVVSQGLLEQLEDDEIATIYANEVGHLVRWTVPLMSAALVILQGPYTLYRLVSEWGNQKQAAVSRVSASLIGAFGYGLFWLWRWLPLWLSRQRCFYGDRVAVELTGNPNAYTRALLKLAIGTAKAVQTQGYTSYLLEGFELLTPLGHRLAVPLGSLYPYTPLEPILAWEASNPYRSWLSLDLPHPSTGERLQLLMLYARHWQLDTELEWDTPAPSRRRKSAGLNGQQWRSLGFQGAPYVGLAFGLAIALLFSAVGWVGARAQWDVVSWMAGDRTLLRGLPLIGFSLGTILRINAFFPDIQPALTKPHDAAEALPALLLNAGSLPVKSQTVRLEGTLIGRSGLSNNLNQDVWLQTPTGLVKLHCTSRLGPFGSLVRQTVPPAALVGQPVKATGWLRRGLSPWIDVETLRTAGGRISASHHPVWSTVAAAIAAAWGILLILNI